MTLASSLADLHDRIRRDGTVAEDVRKRALELADGHWETRLHDQVENLIKPLFDAGLLRGEVEEALKKQEGLDPEVRARAFEALQNWQESSAALNEGSWSVARDSARDPSDYLLALRRAEAACRYDPDYGNFLNTLGMAQYRAGRYRQALDTLTRSRTLNGGRQPADLAFLAMTQQRLGLSEPARHTLAQLRAAVASRVSHSARMSSPAEDAAFLREAEVVIELDPVFPAAPFAMRTACRCLLLLYLCLAQRIANPMSLIVGGIALALLILGKVFLKHRPVALFIVIGGIVAASAFSLRDTGRKADRRRATGNSAFQAACRLLARSEPAASARLCLFSPRRRRNSCDWANVAFLQARRKVECQSGKSGSKSAMALFFAWLSRLAAHAHRWERYPCAMVRRIATLVEAFEGHARPEYTNQDAENPSPEAGRS